MAIPHQLLSGLNVLVVDDDSDTLTVDGDRAHATAGERHGSIFGGRAIEAITLKRPDVLVSDIAMPDEDGYGLIKKVRSWRMARPKTFRRWRSRRTRKKRIVSERCRQGFRFIGQAGGIDRVDFRCGACSEKRLLDRITGFADFQDESC
jgi:CheY-like chemotaxis protein